MSKKNKTITNELHKLELEKKAEEKLREIIRDNIYKALKKR